MKRYGIGSSDACLVHGIPSFGRTDFDLYAEMLGGGKEIDPDEHRENEQENFRLELGNALEDTLMDGLVKMIEKKVGAGGTSIKGPDLFDEPLVHPQHSFIFDRPDRLVVFKDTVCVLEGKVLTTYAKSVSLGEDEIPENYYYQGLHHVAVAQALSPGKKVRLFYGFGDLVKFEKVFLEMTVDQEAVDAHVERCVEWWNLHVVISNPPPVNGSGASAAKVFKGVSGQRDATNEEASIIADLVELKSVEKDLQAAKEKLEAQLRQLMLDSGADKVKSMFGSYSYTERGGRKTFDKAKFNEAYPGVYDRFVKVGEPYRQALLTPSKKKED